MYKKIFKSRVIVDRMTVLVDRMTVLAVDMFNCLTWDTPMNTGVGLNQCHNTLFSQCKVIIVVYLRNI